MKWSMMTPQKAALVIRTTLRTTGPVPGGLSEVNAIGTQLRDLINSGLSRWRLVVYR